MQIIAENLGLTENGSRAGVITFSWHTEYNIKLKDHATLQDFKKAVNQLPFFGHTTRIDKALKLARKELFAVENGARQNVPKFVILLTDGSQTKDADAVDPALIAEQIRKSGVKMVVIGIGRSINGSELLNIAKEKSSLFLAKDFDELRSPTFTANIAQVSCKNGK